MITRHSTTMIIIYLSMYCPKYTVYQGCRLQTNGSHFLQSREILH